jgi:hypothetical protein
MGGSFYATCIYNLIIAVNVNEGLQDYGSSFDRLTQPHA